MKTEAIIRELEFVDGFMSNYSDYGESGHRAIQEAIKIISSTSLNYYPHFTDRKEQRQVTETMNALLLPILPCFNEETAIKVRRALYLLSQIGIESDSEVE